MKLHLPSLFGTAAFILTLVVSSLPEGTRSSSDRVEYHIDTTEDGSLVVRESLVLEAPVARVWKAYTTSAGFASWAAPVAEVDLRPGGTIRTSYDAESGLDGDQVNTLRIVNFVPERVLTLQADVAPNWPEVLKKDADNLHNIILFEDLGDDRTRLTSYGVGYRDTKELRELMAFFKQANRRLYDALIAHVEGP